MQQERSAMHGKAVQRRNEKVQCRMERCAFREREERERRKVVDCRGNAVWPLGALQQNHPTEAC